jgi:hypothetical protein
MSAVARCPLGLRQRRVCRRLAGSTRKALAHDRRPAARALRPPDMLSCVVRGTIGWRCDGHPSLTPSGSHPSAGALRGSRPGPVVARLNVQRIPAEALFVAACPAARCLGESRALRRCWCRDVMGGESGAANGARKFAVAHSFQQRLGACSVARYKLLRPRSVAGKSTTRSSAGPRNRSRSTPATLFCDMEGHP